MEVDVQHVQDIKGEEKEMRLKIKCGEMDVKNKVDVYRKPEVELSINIWYGHIYYTND